MTGGVPGGGAGHALAGDIADHLRALLRDVICGHLAPNLVAVSDELLDAAEEAAEQAAENAVEQAAENATELAAEEAAEEAAEKAAEQAAEKKGAAEAPPAPLPSA